MYYPQLHLLSLLCWITAPAGAVEQLLTYVDGGIGNVLGSAFGLPGTNATFDYVVVGGGTAGLTIAVRLAEDPTISVAVIEAGGFYEIDNGNRSTVPGYANFYTGSDPKNYQPLVDWGFSTVPQTVRFDCERSFKSLRHQANRNRNGQGAANRRVHYARGKTLGGSSARNYMITHRSVSLNFPMDIK